MSFKRAISSIASANSFFNLAFSSSSAFSRLAQLELKLEEIEITGAETATSDSTPTPDVDPAPEKKPRRHLPEHLTRREETHAPASCACPTLRQRADAQGRRGCDRDPGVRGLKCRAVAALTVGADGTVTLARLRRKIRTRFDEYERRWENKTSHRDHSAVSSRN